MNTFRVPLRPAFACALALLAAAPAAAFTGSSRPQIEREFSKTFPLAAGKRLRVDHANGDVTVTARPGSDVKVHAWIRVSAEPASEAQAFADAVQIEAAAGPEGVHVKTRYPERIGSRNIRLSYSVDYDIEMPEAALLEVSNRFGNVSATGVKAGTRVDDSNGSVTLKQGGGSQRVTNSFGTVSVTDAGGDVHVDNSNGDVNVASVGGAADLTTRFGRVSASRVTGSVTVSGGNGDVTVSDSGAASVKSSFGAIRFSNVKTITCTGSNGLVHAKKVAGAVSIRNSFGGVELADVAGKVDVENSNGNIRVRDLRAGARLETSFGLVDAETVEGDVTVENSNGAVNARSVKGDTKVRTTFGSVTIAGAGGAVDVDGQNGSIEVRDLGAPAGCQPIALRTSFGNVKVAVAEGSGYDVDASTSFGNIQSDYPLSTDRGMTSSTATGRIGDGRCKLTVANSNGGIQVLKARREK